MAVTQYIGARYVPLFADPAEWNSTREYEPLTVVLYQGASYTSRQAVPIGIDISNDDFWVRTADYNAQVNQYRQEVQTFDRRITANATAISNEVSARETAISDEVSARTTADTALDARITTNATAISDETLARTNADSALDGRITANATAISDEVSARETADTTLDGKIDAETAARIAEDTSLSDRIEAIEQGGGSFSEIVKRLDMMQLRTGNMVVLGDSYSQDGIENSANAHWCHRIANAYGLDLFNYAIAGAGWGRQSQLISTQQAACAAAMTAQEKENTSLVIAYAGCNDILNGIEPTAIANGITNFCSWATNTFQNAAIMVIPFNFGFGGLTSSIYNTIHNTFLILESGNLHPRVRIVHYAWIWNFAQGGRFRNQVHPNENGYNAISNYIVNAMHGNENVMGPSMHMSYNSGNLSEIILDCTVTNDDVMISGRVKSSVAGTQTNVLFADTTTSAAAASRAEMLLVPLYQGSTRTVVGEIRFLANGSAQVNLNSSYAVNENLWFNIAFKAQNGMAWHS